MASKVNIIIVGAGVKSRELISKLDKEWNIIVIDLDKNSLELVKKIDHRINTIEGDGSSHYILKQANIENADVLVSLTNHDEINFEIAILLKEKYPEIQFITAIVKKSSLVLFKENDIDVIDVPSMISSFLMNKIDNRASTATDIGLGHGEIAEVTITGTSRILNKKLCDIKPYNWVVGAVYRNNTLILPHGNTMFKENDRVLIISEPSKIHSIAEYISVGDYRFPLNFGNNILSLITSPKDWQVLIDESLYLLREFYSKKIYFLILNDEKNKIFNSKQVSDIKTYVKDISNYKNHIVDITELNTNSTVRVIKDIYKKGSYGLVVLNNEKFNILNKFGVENLIHKLQTFIHSPILIAKGKHPYQSILISDREIDSPLKGFEIGISIAKQTKAKLEQITIKKPEFMEDSIKQSSISEEEAESNKETIKKLSKMYKIDIEQTYLEGNPIKKIKKHSEKKDLLIISQKQARKSTLTSPSENQYLIHQAKASVLIYNFGESEE
jgi:Trk K+ transport system NAD-binding subunit